MSSDSESTEEELVTKPGLHDVLCGRGGGTNNHCGNVKFRQLVNEHKLRYLAASKVEKPKVAKEVVKLWRALDPPGRFLARKDNSRKGPGSVKAPGNIWYDVGDKKAREKASQCLRERTPDVIPFVRELQRQQDFLTGHTLHYVEESMNHGSSTSSSTATPYMHSIDDPDVANAFSQEYFANIGFNNAGGFGSTGAASQMTQEEQWESFQGTSNKGEQPTFFPEPQLSINEADFDTNLPDSDELTLDEYTKSMEEFLLKNNISSGVGLPTDMKMRTKKLEGLKKEDSWMKSFNSIDALDTKNTLNKKTPKKTNKKKRSSLEDTIQSQQRSVQALQLAGQGMSTRTELTTGTQMTTGTTGTAVSKMSAMSAFSAMSGVSMFSEWTEESRARKMSVARGLNSNLSMLSEMTDLSDSLKSLDLATVHSKGHYFHD